MLKRNNTQDFTGIETIIACKVSITGEVQSEGSLRIDGELDGRIEIKGDLVVGEKGSIKGKVNLNNVLVAGRIEGDIKARGKVKITATGTVLGDVESETFVVEEGGKFQGNCKMAIPVPEKRKYKLDKN